MRSANDVKKSLFLEFSFLSGFLQNLSTRFGRKVAHNKTCLCTVLFTTGATKVEGSWEVDKSEQCVNFEKTWMPTGYPFLMLFKNT